MSRALPVATSSLVQALLDEQQDLSAVERFAEACDRDSTPAEQRYYRDLLPARAPGPGQQYAFEVDLDACSGCKSCVAACNHLNGLDQGELWRTVGLLVGGTSEAPLQQTVTTSCHHCVDPACMRGCPVNAYEKDLITGIVVHLDDQCIGCQYCTFMCPYDAPRYSKRRGVVRKCDMCSQRLAVGEAPACVQACPSQAIRIGVIDAPQAVQESEANLFLPGTAVPADTVPTTRYTTRRAMPKNLLPADYYTVRKEDAHPPLVLMLVLTQLSVGAYAVSAVVALLGSGPASSGFGVGGALLALCLGLGALVASVFHLGRPWLAFRALLGLRTSWISREIAAFSLFTFTAALHASSYRIGDLAPWRSLLGAMSGAVGLAAVLCSVMVYAATRREHWRAAITGFRFLGTTAVLGTGLVLAVSAASEGAVPRVLLMALIGAAALKLIVDLALLRHLGDRRHGALRRVAMLMVTELRTHTIARFAAALIGGVVIPGLLLAASGAPPQIAVSPVGPACVLVLCLVGELLERHLFFTAAPAPRMPGAPA
jgi:Fe-S-cluster-containing dehydrogenase component/DMSO reductase anchor subunit